MHRLVRNTGQVFGALNERQGALRELILNSKRTFEATASRDKALAETFAIFPTFLDESKATMARLEDFSRSTHPLVNDLKGPADDLGPTVRDLGDLAPDLEKLFRDLGPLIRESRTGVPALETHAARGRAARRGAAHVLPRAEPDPVLLQLPPADDRRLHHQRRRRHRGGLRHRSEGPGADGHHRGPLVRGLQVRRQAARLGARQRVPPAELARPRAGARRDRELQVPERRAEVRRRTRSSRASRTTTSWRPCFEAAAVALRRPHLPVPAQGRGPAARGAARLRRVDRRPPTPTRTTENRDNPAMPFLFGKAYRRLGKHYFWLYVAFEFVSAFVVCLATVGLFALYTDPSSSEFWTIAAFAEVCVALSTGFMLWGGAKRVRPIIDWMDGHGDALEAWRSRRRGAARADPAGRLAAVPPDRRAGVGLRDARGRPRAVQRLHHLRRRGRGGRVRRGAALLLLRAVPAAGRRGHRQGASRRLHRRPARRAAALEAARRAAADQRDHRRGGERAVHRRKRAAERPRARRGGGRARGVHDLARADPARHALGAAAGGRSAGGHRGGQARRPRRARARDLG